EWFKRPGPKEVETRLTFELLNHPCLASLPPINKLATLTALVACSITSFFKREYTLSKLPDGLVLSGGGTNNLALVEFLKAYFNPLQLKNCEDLGIPSAAKSCLSLALTFNSCLNDERITVQKGLAPRIGTFGRWIAPMSR
ncbi:MAG: anhydro-N-acetylmuramic acid kinase, partial [Chitinivibrionales bacterium]|nr:anhydro-N-acetylmuramic acid kinase [Chitinivibrionales bacterium]